MTTKTFIALLMLALTSSTLMAGSTVLAAPPAKGDVDELYQIRVSMPFNEGSAGAALQTDPDQDVPVGKLLMIRNANYHVRVPAGQTGACRLVRFGGLDLFFMPAPTEWLPAGSGDHVGYGNFQSEYYLDEGDFTVACARSSGTGDGSAIVTLTGYLVDAP